MKLAEDLADILQEWVPLTDHTYYKMGGVARYMAFPRSLVDAQRAILFARTHDLPCALLGSGSNLVFADGVFEGLVITTACMNLWYWQDEHTLFAQAGVTNTQIAEICAQAGRDGAWWLFRMPGQVGGTVRMNARCYGGEMQQIVSDVLVLDPDGQLISLSAQEVFYGYKDTALMALPRLVVGVRFHLPQAAPYAEIQDKMQACLQDRLKKHHFDWPSCGSTFKNNYDFGRPSGRIFDELGLKGLQQGQAGVSQFHANFIWNYGGATTQDMLQLAATMRQRAKSAYGVALELEVQPVGLFAPPLFADCGMASLGPCVPQADGRHWVGLFWSPISSVPKQAAFPRTLFSSPFCAYFSSSLAQSARRPVRAVARLIQLCAYQDAQQDPDKPFLRWETHYEGSAQALFPHTPSQPPGFVPQLWHYSVSEIFLARPSDPTCYREYELTPQGHWIGLAFCGVRIPLDPQSTTAHAPEPADTAALRPGFYPPVQGDEGGHFGAVFCLRHLQDLIEEVPAIPGVGRQAACVWVQCALSLGEEQYFLAPAWPDTVGPADFHQPQRFWPLLFW